MLFARKLLPRTALVVAALVAASAVAPAAPPQPPAAGGQAPEGSAQGVFVEHVNVNVVNVDVYVTDKRGHRVTGLTRDDFQIFEDGRPVAITNFYAVENGRPATPALPAATAGKAAPPPKVRPEPPPVPEDQRLYLVVYVDNFNIRPQNRNRVMKDLRSFLLERLDRDDRVMLVTYDRSLHVRQTFTSDPRLVASATFELEKLSGMATLRDSERRQALDSIEDASSEIEALSSARSYAESVENDLSFSVDAIKQIVSSLAGLPGRKAILYVGDGLPMVAGEDLFHAVDEKFKGQSTSIVESFAHDYSQRFRELTAQANANRVTFYTLDATGLSVAPSLSAAEAGPSLSPIIDSIRSKNLQLPLRVMADSTGGMAIYNTNASRDRLKLVGDDFDNYYSLGYSPAHYGDGRYYKIDVKVKRKGLVVRNRDGYRDLSTGTRMNDGTLAALYYDFEENPLGVGLDFAEETRRDDGFYLVPIQVKIALGKVVLVPQGDQRQARVRLYVAARDSKGGISPVQEVPVAITIPAGEVEEARKKYYLYSVTLLMRAGEQKVAVGVRDELGSETSFISRSILLGG